MDPISKPIHDKLLDEYLSPLQNRLSIVRSGFVQSKYERILLTKLRNKNTSMHEFRHTAHKLAEQLVEKVLECLETTSLDIETPVAKFQGEILSKPVDLVSVMRSGDALLETFLHYFPDANISKILIQRDEETAEPQFKYKKLSSTLSANHPVIITEPMIATGGTLCMVIHLLKELGVKESNIFIASICSAPEGLLRLNEEFPSINVVTTVLDERLNEKKYIVPGLGDFGDRYFGTVS